MASESNWAKLVFEWPKNESAFVKGCLKKKKGTQQRPYVAFILLINKNENMSLHSYWNCIYSSIASYRSATDKRVEQKSVKAFCENQ